MNFKFAKDVVDDIKNRDKTNDTANYVSGEDFEQWLYDQNLLEEFIKYGKEQGYNIKVEKSDDPDAFEKIFGVSFFRGDYMKPQGCEFCNDLRNIQPAKYISGGGEEFSKRIQEAHEQKKFLLISKNRFTIVHECPVCGYEFTEEDYDSY